MARGRRRRRCQLIMWSGGLDSTYLLKKALVETEDIVIAHHIHLKNKEDRHIAEAEACHRIREYCKSNFRPFFYSETSIDRSKMDYFFGVDVMTAAFEAGLAAANFQTSERIPVDFWRLGDCAEDAENPMLRLPKRYDAIEGAAMAGSWPYTPPRFINFTGPPKSEIVRYLGDELSELCWVCRNPRDGRECGECSTCEIVSEI